jgi:hypothetical protein
LARSSGELFLEPWSQPYATIQPPPDMPVSQVAKTLFLATETPPDSVMQASPPVSMECTRHGQSPSRAAAAKGTVRTRTPRSVSMGRRTAFPSGHATQSLAFYAMLAIVLGVGRSVRAKSALWSAAALAVVVVGASRICLRAYWMTDVLGGYALGATSVAVAVVFLVVSSRGTGGANPTGEGSEWRLLGAAGGLNPRPVAVTL